MSFRTALTICFTGLALVLLAMLCIVPKANAFEGKWGFEKRSWEVVKPEPKTNVDRSVLMSGQENKDETVLVRGVVSSVSNDSSQLERLRPYESHGGVQPTPYTDNDVIVTTSLEYDPVDLSNLPDELQNKVYKELNND